MKKFVSIFIFCMLISIPGFSVGVKADLLLGSAAGTEIGVVLGDSPVFKNEVGFIFYNREAPRYYERYDYMLHDYTYYLAEVELMNFGVFYNADFNILFNKNSPFVIGLDLQPGLAFCFVNEFEDVAFDITAEAGLVGYYKNLGIKLGWKERFHLVTAEFSGSFDIGVKYQFKGKAAATSNAHYSVECVVSNPPVHIIDGITKVQ